MQLQFCIGIETPYTYQPYRFEVLVEHAGYNRSLWIPITDDHLICSGAQTVGILTLSETTSAILSSSLLWRNGKTNCFGELIPFTNWETSSPQKMEQFLSKQGSLLDANSLPWLLLNGRGRQPRRDIGTMHKLADAVRRGVLTFQNMHLLTQSLRNAELGVELILFFNTISKNASYLFLEEIYYKVRQDYCQKRLTALGPPNAVRLHTHPRVELLIDTIFFAERKDVLNCIACSIPEIELMSFSGLISAYDIPSWIFLVGTYIIFGAFVAFTTTKCGSLTGQKDGGKLVLKEGPFYMGVKVFLEQGIDISDCHKKISYIYTNCTFGPWILGAVVLSNAYRGENISKIAAPLPPIPIKGFAELVARNFTVYTPVDQVFQRHVADCHEFFINYTLIYKNFRRTYSQTRGEYHKYIYNHGRYKEWKDVMSGPKFNAPLN